MAAAVKTSKPHPSASELAYARDYVLYVAWCEQNNLRALPAKPETIARFVQHLIDKDAPYSTIERRVYGIIAHHEEADKKNLHPIRGSKLISDALAIARKDTRYGRERKKGLTSTGIRAILLAMIDDDSLIAARDRAILTVGYALGLKPAMHAALLRSDVDERADAVSIFVDPRHERHERACFERQIEPNDDDLICPLHNLRAYLSRIDLKPDDALWQWIRRGEHPAGPMTARRISKIIKQRASDAGMDPTLIAGLSSRIGKIVDDAAAGDDEYTITERIGYIERVHVRPLILEARRAGRRALAEPIF